MKVKTGKNLKAWLEFLDKMGANEFHHKEIADHLHEKEGIPYWWAQTITVEYERYIGRRVKGQTADGLFQLGIRRTFRRSPEDLWRIISENGNLWSDDKGPAEISRFTTLSEGSHFRMPWERDEWNSHSILQIRILETDNLEKSVLAIHQEKIPDLEMRNQLKEYWASVLDQINLFD